MRVFHIIVVIIVKFTATTFLVKSDISFLKCKLVVYKTPSFGNTGLSTSISGSSLLLTGTEVIFGFSIQYDNLKYRLWRNFVQNIWADKKIG